jgi:hypothetical protein
MGQPLFKLFILASMALVSLANMTNAEPTKLFADPARMIETAKRMDFVGKNAFVKEQTTEGLALRSTPQRSASGLYQRVNIRANSLRPVTWRWRVDKLQRSADIRKLATEDVGAAIFFVFGEPSVWNKDVPTLGYVWTATPVANGAILRSLRYDRLRYIQLRGLGDVGAWQREQRDVARDYRRIFGSEPPALVYVAVFNDNDQTGEPASALFGALTWSE